MVIAAATSPTVLSGCQVTLLKQKTSSLSDGNDVMNNAFYEPENDLEAENQRIKGRKQTFSEEPTELWEKRLDELTEQYPFLMLEVAPILVQLILIFILTVVCFITGISTGINMSIAFLYHHICLILGLSM